MSLVHNQRSIPQASKQGVSRMFQTQDWTALGVTQGQKTLSSRVHAAVHLDACRETQNACNSFF